MRWKVDVIITDVTRTWLDLRKALEGQHLPLTISNLDADFCSRSGLRQDRSTARPDVPLDDMEILPSVPVFLLLRRGHRPPGRRRTVSRTSRRLCRLTRAHPFTPT